jgi:hypothetical protein
VLGLDQVMAVLGHVEIDQRHRVPLAELEKALMVRQGEGGYRIPTPAEDDWDQTRSGIDLRGADRKRTLTEVLSGFWAPQPAFNLVDTKQFRAGLMVNGTDAVPITFHVQLADDATEAGKTAEELRRRSQLEARSVFRVVTLHGDIEREALEAFRSSQMIERKLRGATTADETTLIAEEKVRQKRHQDELRRANPQRRSAARLRACRLSHQLSY